MKEYRRNLGTSEDANKREGRVSSVSVFVWPRFKSVGRDQRLRAECATALIFLPMLSRHWCHSRVFQAKRHIRAS